MYRGKENEASIDRERLAACTLEELQVGNLTVRVVVMLPSVAWSSR